MEYRVDREALAEFIGRQVEQLRLRHESVSREEVCALVEALSIPKLLADVVDALAGGGARDACRPRDLRGARALRHRA